MLTLFTKNTSNSHWVFALVLGVLCLVSPLNLQAGSGTDGNPSSSSTSAASGWFSIKEMKPVGELLYFTYTIRYPGMTKVRLYEGESEISLWRGQYVNREEGTYTVRFHTEMMKSGSQYRFEFEYKSHIVVRFFTP